MAINNLRTSTLREDDGGGFSPTIRSSAAAPAAPAAAPAAPTPEQWQRIVNGETMIIGGAYYFPERTGQTGSAEQGDVSGGELTGRVLRYTNTGGGAPYEALDTSGNVVGTGTFKGSKGFFGDLFSMTGEAIRDTAPIWGAALGLNALLGPSLATVGGAGAGTAGAGSTIGITGAEAAASGAGASAAPTAINTLSSATGLTPAALEAAIGTPGYGANAAAAASGITPSAGFAGMSAADFGMSGAQTAAYDAAIAAGAAPEAAAAAANAAPGIGAPGATAATAAAANAAAKGATAVDPFSFIVPAASSLIGGVLSANAAEKAAEATGAASTRAAELQYQAQKDALALQEKMYRESVERQQPYYEAGTNALAQMRGLTGAMPPAFQYRPEQLTTDPGYGFRLSEGLKALERSAAARGGLLSGGTGKALTRYGQEMGSQEFGNAYNRALTEYNSLRQREGEQYNRLAGLAGVGGTTAQQLTSAGQQYGQQAGNLLTGTATNVGSLLAGQGQTQANALLASGSAYQRSAGDIASLYARMYGPQPTYLYPGMTPPGP